MRETRVRKNNNFFGWWREGVFLVSGISVCLAGSAAAQSNLPEMKSMPVKLMPAKGQSANQRVKKLEELIEEENLFDAQDLLKSFSAKEIEQNLRLLICRALVAKGLYHPEDAYNDLKAALKLNKDFAPAQFEMALLLMERKEWTDAEVLLRLAASSGELTGQRRIMLPYYLGVIAFETGRLFEARSSFVRLTWNETLDPALQQSTGAFISKIVKLRPWSLVSPLSYQYESNALGLSRSSPLPADYERRDTSKIIGGIFGNLEGLGAGKSGTGPLGIGLRLFAIQNLSSKFKSLNVQFIESELNWSNYLGQDWGLLKIAGTANYIRAGGRSLSATAGVKSILKENELTVSYETDLQKNSLSDKSSFAMRIFRDQSLASSGQYSFSIPLDSGLKIAKEKMLGENNAEGSFAPSLSYFFTKRMSAKLSTKLGAERTWSQSHSTFVALKSAPSLSLSWSLHPSVVLSTNGTFEWEKNLESGAIVQKGIATASLLGVL